MMQHASHWHPWKSIMIKISSSISDCVQHAHAQLSMLDSILLYKIAFYRRRHNQECGVLSSCLRGSTLTVWITLVTKKDTDSRKLAPIKSKLPQSVSLSGVLFKYSSLWCNLVMHPFVLSQNKIMNLNNDLVNILETECQKCPFHSLPISRAITFTILPLDLWQITQQIQSHCSSCETTYFSRKFYLQYFNTVKVSSPSCWFQGFRKCNVHGNL